MINIYFLMCVLTIFAKFINKKLCKSAGQLLVLKKKKERGRELERVFFLFGVEIGRAHV